MAAFNCLLAALPALLTLALAPANAWAQGPRPSYPNCTSGGPRQHMYKVNVLDRDPLPDDAALISHANGSSEFMFNFATAWFPPADGSKSADGLVVRVVECSPDHHACPGVKHPEWSNAGAFAIVPAHLPASGPLTAAHVDDSLITWSGATPPPHSNTSKWGAADPRIAYRPADKTYYLTWDNCTQNCYPHRTTLLSTTKNPEDPNGWTLHGPLLPGVYTGGASLLFRDDARDAAAAQSESTGKSAGKHPPHLAFVGNSNTANTILLAESDDGLVWTEQKQVFMAGREGCWDSAGVAAGPQPERLSTGDYFYIYNIDTGFPYHKQYLGRCAIGWAILDKDDPTKIVARSDDALLIATFPWETCPEGKGRVCQEPMVVFSTGMKPLGNDEFYVLYGAADSNVGVAKVKVDVTSLGLR